MLSIRKWLNPRLGRKLQERTWVIACVQYQQQNGGESGRSSSLPALLTGALFASAAAASCSSEQTLPAYRKQEIERHNCKEKGIWIIYKNEIYDITKFVANHPGGADKIMLAAGDSIEPFWNLYPVHYKSTLPSKLLSEMKIGVLHPDDVAAEEAKLVKEASKIGDLYGNEPASSPLLRVHMQKPTNAEAPSSLLTDAWITPRDLWFVRNHHPVPTDEGDSFRITLQLPNKKSSVEYTVAELKSNFKKRDVVSTIQCGGNRRSEMNLPGKVTSGSPWLCGAASTAKWSGVYLSDILLKEGIDYYNVDETGAKHVQLVSVDGLEASIPVRKAVDIHGEVLLAYAMNDEPLPRQHGAPLRVIVPGHVGVRNVKWIKKILMDKEEAKGPWQRGMAYKGFGPSTTTLDGIDVESIVSVQEQPVQSVITIPRQNALLEGGTTHTLQGWAYSGGGRGITRVDVSIDDGKSWKTAKLTEGSHQPIDRAWAWTFWTLDVDLPESMIGQNTTIICKATDASYNVQPDSIEGIWNLRGINNNAWHRVKVAVVAEDADE